MSDHLTEVCSFSQCLNAVQSAGLCAGHYKQQQLGKPLLPLRRLRKKGTPPVIEFDLDENGCHVFRGGTNSHGYGAVSVGKRMVGVHCHVWEQQHGPIPNGLMVDHQCRNRRCCNVAHLRLVTNRVNSLENSVSFAAVNAVKTHCPYGHPYAGGNLIVERNNRRKCRLCKQRRERERGHS